MTLPSPAQERAEAATWFFPKNKPISSICLDERSILLFNGGLTKSHAPAVRVLLYG